jgi:hypothetical protein
MSCLGCDHSFRQSLAGAFRIPTRWFTSTDLPQDAQAPETYQPRSQPVCGPEPECGIGWYQERQRVLEDTPKPGSSPEGDHTRHARERMTWESSYETPQIDSSPSIQCRPLQSVSEDLEVGTCENRNMSGTWPIPGAYPNEARRTAWRRTTRGSASHDEWREINENVHQGKVQDARRLLKGSATGIHATLRDNGEAKKTEILLNQAQVTSLSHAMPNSASLQNDNNCSAILFQEKTALSYNKEHLSSEVCALNPLDPSSPIGTATRVKGRVIRGRSETVKTQNFVDQRQWQEPKSLSLGSYGYTRFPSLNNMRHHYRPQSKPTNITSCAT